MPMVLPWIRPPRANGCNTHENTRGSQKFRYIMSLKVGTQAQMPG